MITWLIMLLTPGFLIRNYEGVYEWYYKHTVWKPLAKELKKLNEREKNG